jgi:dihydrodipicolinate synthase/N-acetylneuraminate lyase
MAVLTNEERQDLIDDIQRILSNERAVIAGVTKQDLRAALDAADAWVEANAASYNTALPQPARAALSARQKNYLLEYVLRKRRENS